MRVLFISRETGEEWPIEDLAGYAWDDAKANFEKNNDKPWDNLTRDERIDAYSKEFDSIIQKFSLEMVVKK